VFAVVELFKSNILYIIILYIWFKFTSIKCFILNIQLLVPVLLALFL
jgi:hypothetical protein